MPLRDHFRPPVSKTSSWEELHGQWPATIVQQLKKQLPAGFVAAPRVHLGALVEVDIAAYERNGAPASSFGTGEGAGAEAAVWAPPAPTVAVDTELPEYDEYEVRIYDVQRGRTLVAAIEIVSPANKDRADHRTVFVGKCAALLRQGVAVSVVDLVTARHVNLYAELMDSIGHRDPTMGTDPPHTYASSCRWVKRGKRTSLEAWSHALAVGQPLPTLPLWLTDTLVVPLDLEQSYEKACDDLSIA